MRKSKKKFIINIIDVLISLICSAAMIALAFVFAESAPIWSKVLLVAGCVDAGCSFVSLLLIVCDRYLTKDINRLTVELWYNSKNKGDNKDEKQ